MPIAIMTSDKDDVCPADQAQWIFRKIQSMDKRLFVVHSMAHERFVTTSDVDYFSDIKRALLVGTEYGNEAVHIDEILQLLQK